MNVKDDIDPLAKGAKVYLFDDFENLNQSITNYKAVSAIDSTVVANGKASLKIEGLKTYYLYIIKEDVGRRLILTNEGEQSTTITPLYEHLNVTVDITLSPVNANLAFWTTDKNKLPIVIRSGQDTYTITSSLASAPTSVNTSNVQNVRKGVHSFYAYNADGCIWEDKINIKAGEFRAYEFAACVKSDVVFYTPNINASLLPISITINDTEDVGNLTTTKNSFECTDSRDSTLTIKKEVGAFTFVAYSKNKKCAWTGTFIVNANECTKVALVNCK